MGNRDAPFVTNCQLQTLSRTDYNITLTDSQWARLQAAFPGGVCDWSKPDAAVTPSVPWLDFTSDSAGTPMTAPVEPMKF